jgi:tetratricopeptide (TPR) repeat protein
MAVCFSVGENVEAVSTWRKARSCGISSREAEQIRKEIQKYRSIPDFAYILADLYGLRGDFHLARKELQKLVALRPNIAEYWLALATRSGSSGVMMKPVIAMRRPWCFLPPMKTREERSWSTTVDSGKCRCQRYCGMHRQPAGYIWASGDLPCEASILYRFCHILQLRGYKDTCAF